MAGKQRLIEYDGRVQSVSAWAKETGLSHSTITTRLANGWPIADALGAPAAKKFDPRGRRKTGSFRPCPRLKEHKSSGRAVCEWVTKGVRHSRYFGPWGSAKADAGYRRFQAEWLASQSSPVPEIAPGETATVAAVGIRWLAHCEKTYVKRGKATSEVNLNRSAWRVVGRLFGDLSATEFTPKKLKAVQDSMVGEGWSREYVNAQIARIQRAFAWAVGEELISASVTDALKYVAPIVAGRTAAIERKPKLPIPVEHIAAIRDHLHEDGSRCETLWAMIEVQRIVGLRPGEVCSIRPEDLERHHGDLW